MKENVAKGITQVYLPPTYEPKPACTPQPRGVIALCLVLIVPVPTKAGRLGGWLHNEMNVPHRELNPDMVTHLSTNRARRRLTSLNRDRCTTTTPGRHIDYKVTLTGSKAITVPHITR